MASSGNSHYLDDFLFLGPPVSAAWSLALQQGIATCKWLGVLTRLTFLGTQIDTVAMCLSLSEQKHSQQFSSGGTTNLPLSENSSH